MSSSEIYEDALEVRILTAVVVKDARQNFEQRLKDYGAEITALQYRVLRELQQGQLTIKDLSQRCMVEPATLVPVIDTLERHGFVQRQRDPRDRRRTPLELTAVGVERLSHIPFVHEDDVIVKYLRGLAEDERRSFLEHLRNLVVTIHGNDAAVTRIGQAVKSYFSFGEQQQLARSAQTSRSSQEESSS